MDVKASIREGRRAPCYVAATAVFTGFQQLRATDLGKPFRRQSPGNEFALVVPNEHTVFVLNEKGISEIPKFAPHRRIAFPNTIPGFCLQASQFTISADSVDMVILPNRCTHHRMQPFIES